MRAYKAVVFLLAAIPLLTGPLDLFLGLKAPKSIGMVLSDIDVRDPVLNSQVRFFGAVWFGTGLLMVLGAARLERFGAVLKMTFAVLTLAGLGRLFSMLQFGLPSAPIGAAFILATIVLEIVVAPVMLLWQRRLEQPQKVRGRWTLMTRNSVSRDSACPKP
ncbi:MAG TPA: DUF4345 domain-containing protein [Caulobacteraceae bacterium]|jgi:hypothetical protein